MHEIVSLDSIQHIIATGAGAFGFSKATVPAFGHTIAGGLIRIIGHGLNRLFLEMHETAAGTQEKDGARNKGDF